MLVAFFQICRTKAGLRVRLTVIRPALVIRCDRHSLRIDLQLAVGISIISSIIRIIDESAGGDREVGHGQVHGVGAHVRALGFGGFTLVQAHGHAGGRGVGPLAVADLILYREAGHGLLAAVVGLGSRIAGDLDLQDRLPHSEEVVVGQLFVRSNLSRCLPCRIRVARASPDQEVRARASLGFRPALEHEAIARRSRFAIAQAVDQDSFVDLQDIIIVAVPLIVAIFRTLAIVSGTIVAVPRNVRRGRFFRFLVDGKDLNGICFRPIAVVDDMSIVSFRCKGFTGKHGHTLGIVSIPATVPGFDNPVIKYITIRRSRRSAGADIGVLNIDPAVCGRVGAPDMISTQIIAVCRIDDIDAVCVFKHLTPLGIKVKPLGDPGTVIRGVGVGSAACFHIPRAVPGRRALLRLRVGRRGGLIIVGGNGGFIQPRAFCPGRAAGGVPAQELVAVTFAGRGADRSAVSHTEGQRLVIGAPIEVGIIDLRQAGVQEHTVLDLPPLGVDLNTADRHFAPGVWRSATFIEVPALKDISTFLASRFIVLILIRNRGTLSN